MNNKTFFHVTIAAVLFALALCMSCASSGGAASASGAKANAAGAEFAAFDAVIEKSYNNLSAKLIPAARIALLPLRAADKENGNYAYDTLDVMFNNAGLWDFVTRTELAAIIQEQNFQYSGMVDDRSAAEFGKLLGAQIIIVGDISGSGYTRRLVFRALDVQTGRLLVVTSERF